MAKDLKNKPKPTSKHPLVSVVMPVFNGEKYLREAIDSILNQTFADFEFIIINDGSTDDTLKIIKGYKDPRIVLISRKNKGLVASLNEGIEKARGKYIARMDADDISLPERFEKQVMLLSTHSEIGLVGSLRQNIDMVGNRLEVVSLPLGDEEIRRTMFSHNPFTHGSIMVSKKLLEAAGGYEKGSVPAEDYMLWARVLTLTKAANLDSVEYLYRLNTGGITNTYTESARLKVEQRVTAFVMHESGVFLPNNGVSKKLLLRILLNGILRLDFQMISYFFLYVFGWQDFKSSLSGRGNEIKVLQISTFDSRGGASKCAYRLNASLNRRGSIVSNFVAGFKLSRDSTVFQLPGRLLKGLTHGRDNWLSFLIPSFFYLKHLNTWNYYDLLHLHNMHGGFFNLLSLRKISRSKKIIWTLHDPLLINEYGGVPEYDDIFPQRRVSWLYQKVKHLVIPRLIRQVVFTTPSQWLKQKFIEVYPEADVRCIPNSIDLNIFNPVDKYIAREKLGLTQNKFIILHVADDGEGNKSKGAKLLDEICQASDSKIESIVIGKAGNYITDERQLALYYSAADVFVFPTQAENFPLVTLESMACGTPVVSYRVGGIPEQIEHMVNGCLVERGDEAGLKIFIEQLAKDRVLLRTLSRNALDKVEKEYSEEVIMKKISSLYLEVMHDVS